MEHIRTKEKHLGEMELDKAFDRLGRTYADTMKWAVRFAQCDLSTISEGDWLNLAYEVTAFTRYGVVRRPWSLHKVLKWAPGKPLPYLAKAESTPGWGDARSPVELPKKEVVIPLQAITLGALHSLVEQEVASFKLPAVWLEVIRLEPSSPGTVQPVSTAEGAFTYHLAHLLAENAGNLRRCPECQKFFVADRRNQRYCTVSCQTRVASRKYLGTPPDRIGKRGRPSKKIQQRNQKLLRGKKLLARQRRS